MISQAALIIATFTFHTAPKASTIFILPPNPSNSLIVAEM
jgi:hypothetical protein